MGIDTEKFDQAVLALLLLGRHDDDRTGKSFDWEVMGRLHQKGYITDPVSKTKSVLFTPDGLRVGAGVPRAIQQRLNGCRRNRPAPLHARRCAGVTYGELPGAFCPVE